MLLNIAASIVIAFWLPQGLYTAKRIWSDGYAPLWWLLMGVMALLLLLPASAIWF